MDINVFIGNYTEAFGEKAPLPMVFWYSAAPAAVTDKINGCFFKGLAHVMEGGTISINAENIGCPGGKFYTGYSEMMPMIPDFVSLKEKYKRTPGMVLEFIDRLGMPEAPAGWLNFTRIDNVESFDPLEGVLFYANPDMLSGLTTWAFLDNNSDDAVCALFGSGCSAVVSQAVTENRKQGRRTFLGLFDPSVRPYVGADVLSFVIPISRFREMYHTMKESCLFNTHAWEKVKKRINEY